MISGQTTNKHDIQHSSIIIQTIHERDKMNTHKGRLPIAAVMVICVSTACRSAEFHYASYVESTLQNIIAEELNHSVGSAGHQRNVPFVEIECQVAKYRVLCNYTAIRRPISGKNKNLIQLWMKTLQIETALASLYRQEIKVMEGMNAHWIPVQDNLLPHLDRELSRNDAIELFILFLGKTDSGYVFIATEFEKIDLPQIIPQLAKELAKATLPVSP